LLNIDKRQERLFGISPPIAPMARSFSFVTPYVRLTRKRRNGLTPVAHR